MKKPSSAQIMSKVRNTGLKKTGSLLKHLGIRNTQGPGSTQNKTTVLVEDPIVDEISSNCARNGRKVTKTSMPK